MMTNTPIDASGFEGTLNRLLNLTDQAWQANASNSPFEYKRVERDFENLLGGLDDQTVSVCGSRISLTEFARILSALAHAKRTAKRLSSLDAFSDIVKAVEPLSDKNVALSTAKRGQNRGGSHIEATEAQEG